MTAVELFQAQVEAFGLTAREQQVVRQLVAGQTNPQIARVLGCCEKTVKNHVRSVMQKTGTPTRTGAVCRLFGLDRAFRMEEFHPQEGCHP